MTQGRVPTASVVCTSDKLDRPSELAACSTYPSAASSSATYSTVPSGEVAERALCHDCHEMSSEKTPDECSDQVAP